MMEALERFFDCSGFSAQTTPISNLYQFTDINSPGPIPGNVCLAHYDTLIYSSTFMIGGQFFSISMSALFLWVWLAVVGMNKGLSR